MITHEIRRPAPPAPPVTQFPSIRNIKQRLLSRRGGEDETVFHHGPAGARIAVGTLVYMDKIAFIRWIEEEVKPRFSKGTLCTMRGLAYMPGHVPEPLFEVMDVQEMHMMAPIDPNWNEPRCLFIRNRAFPSGFTTMCPCQIRPLQQEELNLVHARNKAAETLRDKLAEADGPNYESDTKNESYSG